MGYTLTIGELKVNYDQDLDYPRVDCSADGFEHPEAPAFGEPTDNTSSRWPSYTGWRDFCVFAGLEELFYGAKGKGENVREDYLIIEHPGCIPLTTKHREEVNAAMENFKKKHPKAVPTYGNATMMEPDPNNPEENGQMCRLVWLHYWVNWAMDKCEKPVFYNS